MPALIFLCREEAGTAKSYFNPQNWKNKTILFAISDHVYWSTVLLIALYEVLSNIMIDAYKYTGSKMAITKEREELWINLGLKCRTSLIIRRIWFWNSFSTEVTVGWTLFSTKMTSVISSSANLIRRLQHSPESFFLLQNYWGKKKKKKEFYSQSNLLSMWGHSSSSVSGIKWRKSTFSLATPCLHREWALTELWSCVK